VRSSAGDELGGQGRVDDDLLTGLHLLTSRPAGDAEGHYGLEPHRAVELLHAALAGAMK
jgi:hypothetical protein